MYSLKPVQYKVDQIVIAQSALLELPNVVTRNWLCMYSNNVTYYIEIITIYLGNLYRDDSILRRAYFSSACNFKKLGVYLVLFYDSNSMTV